MMTKLTQLLTCLSQGSSDSVQDGLTLSTLDKYLHIKRSIEDTLAAKMTAINSENGGIVLLIGSAGDGKSHLISTIREDIQFEGFRYHNDATESYSPTKTAVECLKDVLIEYSDERINSTEQKLVLAINIGKLNAFIEDPEVKERFSVLVDFVNPLFEEGSLNLQDSKRIKVVQFTNQQIFEFDKDNDSEYPVDSIFLREFLKRITDQNTENPFYTAYKNSIPLDNAVTDPVVLNYQLLSIPDVQNTIIKLVIESIVRFKLMVTPREFQDFV